MLNRPNFSLIYVVDDFLTSNIANQLSLLERIKLEDNF